MKLTLSEVAKHVDGEVVGESDTTISGVSEIQNASPGTITFLGNPLYSKYLKDTKADAVFVDKASVSIFRRLNDYTFQWNLCFLWQ